MGAPWALLGGKWVGFQDQQAVAANPDKARRAGQIEVLQAAADFDLELSESRTLDGHTQELIYRPTLHG